MNLLVVRHAIAEDPADWARSHPDDAGRPLTAEGKKKMRSAARGLTTLVPEIAVLATSPLTRARQTADIVAEAYGGIDPVVVAVLAPGQPVTALSEWLMGQRARDTIAIVGHEPALSRSVSWFLAAAERSFLELKKGAACLLEFESSVGPGTATLRWALTPAQLRDLKA